MALVAALVALGAVAAYVVAAVGEPSFGLQATPSSQTVVRGGSATYTITVTRWNGFTGPVTLAVGKANLPDGVTISWNPSRTVPAESDSTTLSLQTSPATPPGSTDLKITGTDASGEIRRNLYFTLVVQRQKNFSLAASPTSRTAYQGAQPADFDTAAYTVTLTRSGGFTGPVGLGVSGLPSGVTVGSWSPSSTLSGDVTSATLRLRIAATTSTGSYPLTITGDATIYQAGTATPTQRTTGATLVVEENKAFTISGGGASDLVPGATQPLNLSLTNPYADRNLKISEIEVTIESTTNEPDCGTESFDATDMSLATPVTLATGSTRTLTQLGVDDADKPSLSMLDTAYNQDACKGVTVDLDYSGSASK